MGLRLLAALGLTAVGAVTGQAVAATLGAVAVLLETVNAVWARRGLGGVTYRRRLGRDRLEWGEDTELELEVRNAKALPLGWLRADDAASDGVIVRERAAIETPALGTTLRNAWTLAPFERVVRHLRVGADRRGVFALGPAILIVGDPFARRAAAREEPATSGFLVRPRVVPAASAVRPEHWGDLDRARHGMVEDPARFAGIRPYQPGDPLRRLHHRASARLRMPVTKHFEPSRERDVLVALDLEPDRATPGGRGADDEALEARIVVVASLVRALEAAGAGVGLTVAAYTGRRSTFADVPVSTAAGRGDRVLDMLARISGPPAARFTTTLARVAARDLGGPTTVVAVSDRDVRDYLDGLVRLRRRGFAVIVLATGPEAATHAARARAAGFGARVARLDGPWRAATRLEIG